MRWSDIFRLTALQYRANRLRNLLCMLAVAVGVFALVFLSNIGSFAAAQVTGMLDAVGLQGMTVYLKESTDGEALTTAFAAYMEENVEGVDAVTPIKFAGGTYKCGHHSGPVGLIGADAGITDALTLDFLHGQGFVEGGMVDVQNPIIISDRFARTIYSRDNVVGKQLYITVNGKQERYTVVGVIRDQLEIAGGMLGSFIPELAYIPLEKLAPTGATDQILFSSELNVDEAAKALEAVGAGVFHMRSALSVQNLTGFLDQIEQAAGKVRLFFTVIAGFSMVVALFAIENSMLSAIHEMQEELLLYRVIGLRRVDVVRLVLAQSTGICLAGAACGVILGALTAWGVGRLLPGFALARGMSAAVLAGSILLGVLSGLVPALMALHDIKKELYE